MATFTDDFNRANGAMGVNWTTLKNGFTVVSNAAAPSNTATTDDWNIYTGTIVGADQYVKAKLTCVGTNGAQAGIALALRTQADATVKGYRFIVDHAASGNCSLDFEKDSSAAYINLKQFTQAWTNGDTWEVRVTGTSPILFTFLLNGATITTHSESTNLITTGQPGISFSSAETSASIDDFEGGDYTAGGGGAPFKGSADPSPTRARLGIDARGFTDASEFWLLKDTQFRGPGQFTDYDWPNPQRPRPSIDLLTWTGNDLTSRLPIASQPFAPVAWPNPRGIVFPPSGFTLSYVVDDNVPFYQDDWPNPVRAKGSVEGIGWQDLIGSLLVPVGAPLRPIDWPNPVRARGRVDGLSWADELNTLLFPTGPPFRPLAWPNPWGPTPAIALKGFAQVSAFWLLKDRMYGGPGQPLPGNPPVHPRIAPFPIEARGSVMRGLVLVPAPVFTLFRRDLRRRTGSR